MKILASIWLIELGVFLLIFAGRYATWTQAGAHGLLVVVYATSLLAVAQSFAGSIQPAGISRSVFAIILGAGFFVLACFHAFVLVALANWGQLPTIELAGAYLKEVKYLEEALGLRASSLAVTALAGLVVSVLAHAIAYSHLPRTPRSWRRFDTAHINPRERVLLGILVLVCSTVAISAYAFSTWPKKLHEPLHVALNSEGWRLSQSNPITDLRLHQLGLVEDDARRAHPPVTLSRKRNVIVVTVDALRADKLSVNGYVRETTPFLRELSGAPRFLSFEEARAPCAESFCGLLSLLTGKNGHKLAVQNFGLVEVLNRAGYHSTAALSGDHSSFYGLRTAYGPFAEYFDASFGADGRTSMNDDTRVMEQLRKWHPPKDRPTFLFVHLMSAHGLGRKLSQYQKWTPAKSVFNLRLNGPAEEIRTAVINGYDNGVLQADGMLGVLFDILQEKQLLQDAIVFITGDHGEFLGEHARYSHSMTLLEPVLRVPWIWLGADLPKEVTSVPVIQADFAPTLLSQLQIPIPTHWDGIDLSTRRSRRFSFHQQREYVAVIEYGGGSRYKFIVNRRTGQEEAFDLLADPTEKHNVIAEIAASRRAGWRKLLFDELLLKPHGCGILATC